MTKRYARMTGWGRYIPTNILTNADLEKMMDTSDEWIVRRTGIRERHVVEETDSLSGISTKAALEAMKMASVRPADLDLIIVATTTPDFLTPPVSSQVQHMLGADCPAFVLTTGCTGWLYGVATATQFIETGAYNTILVVGAEVISRFLDYSDRTTAVLFGDGAGACILQASDEPTGMLSYELGSDGSQSEHLWLRVGGSEYPATRPLPDGINAIHMNGREVFKFATRTLGRTMRNVLREANMDANDIDMYIPHQANARIIESAARQMGVSMDKFYLNIERYGNTSAASIPIALCEAMEEGVIQPGATLGFVSFGAGLTWASMVIHVAGPLHGKASTAQLQKNGRVRSFVRGLTNGIANKRDELAITIAERRYDVRSKRHAREKEKEHEKEREKVG